jgi:branched-chain amino acid transport system permease protein
VRKLTAVGVGLVLGVMAVLVGASTATAGQTLAASQSATTSQLASTPEETEGETINVRVRAEREGEDPLDVEGVDALVEQGGEEVATGTTDDSGVASLSVPEGGEYSVSIDVGSVPEDLGDLSPLLNPVETTVNAGQARTVAFRLVEGGAGATGDGGIRLDLLPQLMANGLRFGLILALAAIGLSMIYGTTGLTNFAHSELITFGALMGYFFNVAITVPFVGLSLALPLIPASILAVVVCCGFGYLNDKLLWGPLRNRGTGLIAMMIVSIGLAISLRYSWLYIFGGSTRSFDDYRGQAGISLGAFTLRPLDLISMGLAVVVLIGVGLALLRTRLGKATRAVADNPALSAASGIDVDRVIRIVWIGGAGLAGLAGILFGLAQQINYQTGFDLLLLVFAAVTLGGLGTAFGAMIGSVIVGLFIEVSTLVIPTELKNVGALAVLILILLVRPQGILGRAERVG